MLKIISAQEVKSEEFRDKGLEITADRNIGEIAIPLSFRLFRADGRLFISMSDNKGSKKEKWIDICNPDYQIVKMAIAFFEKP